MKHKHTKLDKIFFSLSCLTTILLFVIDKFVHHFIDDLDFIILLEIIGGLSFFFTVLSFTWDVKFQRMKRSILVGTDTVENEKSLSLVRKELIESYNGVQESVATIINATRGSITDSFLSQREKNIENYLRIDSDHDYIIIYIITNSMDVELEGFEDPIRNNIMKDIQYVYMTPLKSEEFFAVLKPKIIGSDKNNHILRAAFSKNIQHISNPEYFEGLPSYSDMVIYSKQQYVNLGNQRNIIEGYFCFQNGPIQEEIKNGDNTEKIIHYYYQLMNREHIEKILTIIDSFKTIKNNVIQSTLTPKVEYRANNSIGIKDSGGLFAIEDISSGETIFTMGGYFTDRQEIQKLGGFANDNIYLQIDENTFLCGLTTEKENCMFKANHSCSPNCSLIDEITFQAMKNIKKNEEILIDYFSLGEHYCKEFICENISCQNKYCEKQIKKAHKNEVCGYSLPFIKDLNKKQRRQK